MLNSVRFSGSDYIHELDCKRLAGQIRRIFDLMKDGHWRSLQEISAATGDGESSISAQLRNLRKEEFGGFIIDRQRAGSQGSGLFVYRLSIPQKYYTQQELKLA